MMAKSQFWETEQRFDTMEIHEHGFLLLALCSSRILRGIRCLSITGSQPLPIGLRRWPQTWRRAKFSRVNISRGRPCTTVGLHPCSVRLPVRENPLQQFFSTEAGGKKRGFPSPSYGEGKTSVFSHPILSRGTPLYFYPKSV